MKIKELEQIHARLNVSIADFQFLHGFKQSVNINVSDAIQLKEILEDKIQEMKNFPEDDELRDDLSDGGNKDDI